jgi:hypothetical protein
MKNFLKQKKYSAILLLSFAIAFGLMFIIYILLFLYSLIYFHSLDTLATFIDSALWQTICFIVMCGLIVFSIIMGIEKDEKFYWIALVLSTLILVGIWFYRGESKFIEAQKQCQQLIRNLHNERDKKVSYFICMNTHGVDNATLFNGL